MDNLDSLLLESILENIKPDNKPLEIIGQQAFDKIDILVERHSKDNFCQLIIDSIGTNTDLRRVAILFDVLVWSTPDNGGKLEKLTDYWLESGNLVKIQCILFRHDWLPILNSWETIKEKVLMVDPNLKNLLDYYTAELKYWKKTGLRRTDVLSAAIDKYILEFK